MAAGEKIAQVRRGENQLTVACVHILGAWRETGNVLQPQMYDDCGIVTPPYRAVARFESTTRNVRLPTFNAYLARLCGGDFEERAVRYRCVKEVARLTVW